MPTLSYPAAFAEVVREAPERTAVICDEDRISRRMLAERSDRLARAYRRLGVREGDRVVIALPNSIEFIAVVLATWKLGAVPTPIPAQLPRAEQRGLLLLAEPTPVVGADAALYPDYTHTPLRDDAGKVRRSALREQRLAQSAAGRS